MPSIDEIRRQLIEDFNMLENSSEKFDYLISLGQDLTAMDAQKQIEANLVKGCQSNVWFNIRCTDGKLYLEADSDSLIVKGLAAILVQVFSGQPVSDVYEADMGFIEQIGLWRQLSSQRGNGLTAMLNTIHARAKECSGQSIQES